MSVKTNNDAKNIIALDALHYVIDPEVGLNIVDLGLVYEVNFDEKCNDITITMTLTTQFCPMGESIVESTTNAMQQAFPDSEIKVNLIFEPAWNVGMISEAGNEFLNG